MKEKWNIREKGIEKKGWNKIETRRKEEEWNIRNYEIRRYEM